MSQPMQDTQAALPRKILDDLPVELQVLVLGFVPDIPTLYALVRSSPSLHKAYVANRHSILFSVLSIELSPSVLQEAIAVYNSSSYEENWTDGEGWIESLRAACAKYNGERIPSEQNEPLFSAANVDWKTLVHITHLQSSIREVGRAFCLSTLSLLPVTDGKKLHFKELSQSERSRIYRACYRLDLHNHIFSDTVYLGELYRHREFNPELGRAVENPMRGVWTPRDMGVGIGRIFFSLFELWEVEEICCIHAFVYRKFNEVFRECGDLIWHRLSEEVTDYGFGCKTREDIIAHMTPKEARDYDCITKILMASGWTSMARTLRLPSASKKASLISAILRPAFAPHGTRAQLAVPQSSLTGNWDISDILPITNPGIRPTRDFTNDGDVENSNVAWVWYVQDLQHRVRIDEFQEGWNWTKNETREALRGWGYVMWDKNRLEEMGITENELQTPRIKPVEEGFEYLFPGHLV